MKAHNKPARLTLPERWFALKSLFQLQMASLAIRRYGFTRVHQELKRRAGQAEPRSVSADLTMQRAAHVGALVSLANNKYSGLRVSCLPESLTVWWLLRREGIEANLRLGIRKTEADLDGHAWVEVAGKVISGDPNQTHDYLPLDFG